MSNKTILVIDDEELIRKILKVKLISLGYKVFLAEDAETGLDILQKEKIDLILSDLSMPGKSGFDILNEVKDKKNIVVIIMTAFANVKTAIKALELGAFDYLIKPFNMEEIPYRLNKAFLFQEFTKKNKTKTNDIKHSFPEILGVSSYINNLKKVLNNVLSNNLPVLITGEQGTGKKHIANVIHKYLINSKEMMHLNITGMNEDNIEKLFHKKEFKIDEQYSTIFIENFNILDFNSQLYIFELIKNYRNIKFIFSTNKKITKYNYTEYILEELYKEISDNIIITEPLNTHKEDIPLLLEHFIQTANKKYNKTVKDVNKNALYFLLYYHWPDNIMELQFAIEKAVFLCDSDLITPDLLFKNIVDYQDLDVVILNPYLSYKDAMQLAKDKVDRHYFEIALRNTSHNKTKAAKLLGISLRQFQYRCKALGIK